MPRDIALIVNPRSHSIRRDGSRLEQAGIAGARVIHLRRFDDLPETMHGLARNGIRRICIEGGDGTVVAVLSACLAPGTGFDTDPPEFAVVAGGSTNLAHEIIGLRARTPQAIHDCLTRYTTARVQQTALHVTSEALPYPQIGFLLSTGALPRVMLYVQHEMHGEGNRGNLPILSAILRFLVAPLRYRGKHGNPILRQTPLYLNSPDVTLDGPHLLSLMTTLPYLSSRINPFWGDPPGAIALTHVNWPVIAPRRSLVRILSRWRLRDLADRGITSYCTDELSLHHAGTLMLDGEAMKIATDTRIRVTTTGPLVFLR